MLLFPPHRSHASPVKRCSSFVVSKQSCQTIPLLQICFLKTFKAFVKAGCPSGAPLCFAVCHAACSSFSFLTAAIVSFTPLRSLLLSFRFITPRSQLNYLHQGRATQSKTQCSTHWDAPAFRKPSLQYSLGSIPLHYIIHSLQ